MADRAKGEWICYLDCDIEVTQPDWFDVLIDTYIDGVSAPKLLYPNGTIQSAGGALEANGLPMRHRGRGEGDAPEWNVPREVVYAPGACHFVRRALLDRVRWTEELRPTYFDDSDFCYQVRWAGEHVWYRPEVVLTHHEGSFQRATSKGTALGALVKNQRLFESVWRERILPTPPGG